MHSTSLKFRVSYFTTLFDRNLNSCQVSGTYMYMESTKNCSDGSPVLNGSTVILTLSRNRNQLQIVSHPRIGLPAALLSWKNCQQNIPKMGPKSSMIFPLKSNLVSELA